MDLTGHLDQVEPSALIVAGFVLFVIPEPATSALGVGLMLLGGSWWFKEWDALGVPGR